MDKFDRIYELHRILRDRRTPISRADIMARLERCSQPTFYRLIRLLRDQLNAPVEWHEELQGYYYRQDAEVAAMAESRFVQSGIFFRPIRIIDPSNPEREAGQTGEHAASCE
ncbi:MAG TPA: hypothetical protein VMP00_02930 [Burkholderiales bacterium]|nr:hypothetical protein [Burkholderiales bacterium]